MTAAEASAALRNRVLEPLNQTVVVRVGGKRFTLPPQRAEVGVDIDGSVRAAVARSREGNVLARAWRSVRGGEVDEELDLSVTYSQVAIDRLVEAGRRARSTSRPSTPTSTSRAATSRRRPRRRGARSAARGSAPPSGARCSTSATTRRSARGRAS